MRKQARIVALLTVLMFLMGSLVPVGAADGTKTLKALFRNLQIIVDGNVLISDKEPFIIDGTTYVPIRLVSEATGAKVDWDPAKGRVLITAGQTVDKGEIERIRQEGYAAGLVAGELSGYIKGLEEGRSQIKKDEDKKKEYDKGYREGESKGEKDGYDAGENDRERNRKSDWEKAIANDSSISRSYRLSSESSDYAEGFLDGYKDEFRSSYRDGFDNYHSSWDAYDDGWYDGYYDGYSEGKYDKDRGGEYRIRIPSNNSIIYDYNLDNKSRSYQDSFVDGYKDNYEKGYEDGWYGEKSNPSRK